MVEFEDPVTGTEYDPTDPAGLALKGVYGVLGITMTLLLFSIAQMNVLPTVQNFLGNLTNMSVGGSSSGIRVGGTQ